MRLCPSRSGSKSITPLSALVLCVLNPVCLSPNICLFVPLLASFSTSLCVILFVSVCIPIFPSLYSYVLLCAFLRFFVCIPIFPSVCSHVFLCAFLCLCAYSHFSLCLFLCIRFSLSVSLSALSSSSSSSTSLADRSGNPNDRTNPAKSGTGSDGSQGSGGNAGATGALQNPNPRPGTAHRDTRARTGTHKGVPARKHTKRHAHGDMQKEAH